MMRIGIVDVSSVFYPAWHASADKAIGFAYEVTVERVRRFASRGFDLVVVACDCGRSFRHELSPRYKAHRAEPDATLVEQIRRVQERLDADGHHVLAADGFEADDIVATVARWATGLGQVVAGSGQSMTPAEALRTQGEPYHPDPSIDAEVRRDREEGRAVDAAAGLREGWHRGWSEPTKPGQSSGNPATTLGHTVTILSSDKDLLALVTEHVSVQGVTSGATLGPAEVVAKWGVMPDQMRDLLALMGDTADGVAGVRGIGQVKAAALLKTFTSIDGIRAAMASDTAEWQPSVYTALSQAFADGSLELSRKLVTLRDDVPLDLAALLQPKKPKELRPDFGADLPEENEVSETSATENQQGASVVQVQETVVAQPEQKEERPEDAADRIMSQVQPVEWTRQLEPRGLRDAVWISKQLHESRLLGGPARDGDLDGKSGYGSPEQILAVILAGRELGLGAMTSLRGINIIKGKVSMSAILMVGMCLARGAEYFDLVESTPERATYETRRRGQQRVLTMSYTLEQAKAAGLYPGKRDRYGNPSQWEKDPTNMLAQRCGARAARAFYPHIVTGVYLPDELSDD